MNPFTSAAESIGTLRGLFQTHPEPETVSDVGYDGWTEETEVEVNTAIMEGIKEELEQVEGITCGEIILGDANSRDHKSGVTVRRLRHQVGVYRLGHHKCNLFLEGFEVVLTKAGQMRARLAGDLQKFDLHDPDSIPQVVEAVKEICN